MNTHIFYLGNTLDVLRTLPNESVHCVVTSPPYWGLRDYGVPGQIGLEPTPEEYVAKMVEVFREVRRVLRGDGTLWLNLGDSYAGSGKGPEGGVNKGMEHRHLENKVKPFKSEFIKPKDLVGIPWRVAFALRDDGWWLRSDIIWAKPNPMPESVTDRPTRSHEYIFLLTKSKRYFYDHVAIQEESVTKGLRGKGGRNAFRGQGVDRDTPNGPANRDGREMRDIGASATRNKRDVWTVATQPFPGAHFAVMPEALVVPCILAGCPENGTVLDPFGGSGTVSVVAQKLGRSSIYIDLNPAYRQMAIDRMRPEQPSLVQPFEIVLKEVAS